MALASRGATREEKIECLQLCFHSLLPHLNLASDQIGWIPAQNSEAERAVQRDNVQPEEKIKTAEAYWEALHIVTTIPQGMANARYISLLDKYQDCKGVISPRTSPSTVSSFILERTLFSDADWPKPISVLTLTSRVEW